VCCFEAGCSGGEDVLESGSRDEGSASEEGGSESGEEGASLPEEEDEEGAFGSEDGDVEQLPDLDAFDHKTRAPVDDFCSAASGPEAFAQPSQDLSDAAKQGLKASMSRAHHSLEI